ncbi:MAG: proprotein convertase P-domain-containing protein [Deltaproteobacteria bacterium]|nr:proprotein convertase P-domain-containing protein [Deltaproteobacteria bacterium]
MIRLTKIFAIIASLSLIIGCGSQSNQPEVDYGPNPFLEKGMDNGKEDTGYVNLRGVEVHVTVEADIQAASYHIFDAPAELAQFAVTYLRKRDNFYLEILAEDSTSAERVEWLVDGEWLTRAEAAQVDKSKLTHFRMLEVNAVVLNSAASNIQTGKVFEAKVPVKHESIMRDADDKCADYNSHIDLGQSIYWYLWNPTRSNCPAELLQTMTLTVAEVLPNNPESYPEYDKLWEDGKLTAAVFFGKLDDGDVADDYNWGNFNKLSTWLTDAGFTQEENVEMGRRFIKATGDLSVVIDVYGPDIFHSVADYARFQNWQSAVSTHEIVMYNGHSVLGTGYAFERAVYPDYYQIFQVASCLSYEYYVRPVLAGKGSWDKIDILSNVQPTYYSENFPLTTTVLAKLIWGFENNGRASWQDIMEAVSRKLGHSRFGVSGARGNCYSPEGDRCQTDPDPDELRYENTTSIQIPDNNEEGISSEIVVAENMNIGTLKLELNLDHTYVGDLKITLTHSERSYTFWSREGGSDDNIHETFELNNFKGLDANGSWLLNISDHAGADTGRLNSWTLIVTPGDGGDPDPDVLIYENTNVSAVPDNDANGVASVIEVAEAVEIGSVKLDVNLSHSYIGDIKIALTHNGATQMVWNREGGSRDDLVEAFELSSFNGVDASGNWTLTVTDHASRDTGSLNSWKLTITPKGGSNPDPTELRYEDVFSVAIPDNDTNGVSRTIQISETDTIANLKVELQVTHTYVGDLQIVLSHNGTDYAIWDRTGGGQDNLQQTFDLTVFNGMSINGDWTLKVADKANIDTGNLDSWALVITPAE